MKHDENDTRQNETQGNKNLRILHALLHREIYELIPPFSIMHPLSKHENNVGSSDVFIFHVIYTCYSLKNKYMRNTT